MELVFINRTTIAKEVNEEEFFHKGESGGTFISSAYEKALAVISGRYSPEVWNIYAFHCSDGDNWVQDTPRALALAGELCSQCNLFGYGEINETTNQFYKPEKTILDDFDDCLQANNFVAVTIDSKDDIWPAFRKLLTIVNKE